MYIHIVRDDNSPHIGYNPPNSNDFAQPLFVLSLSEFYALGLPRQIRLGSRANFSWNSLFFLENEKVSGLADVGNISYLTNSHVGAPEFKSSGFRKYDFCRSKKHDSERPPENKILYEKAFLYGFNVKKVFIKKESTKNNIFVLSGLILMIYTLNLSVWRYFFRLPKKPRPPKADANKIIAEGMGTVEMVSITTS